MHLASKTLSSNLSYSSFLTIFINYSKESSFPLNRSYTKEIQSSLALRLLVKSSICSDRSSLGLIRLAKSLRSEF